MPCYFLQVEQEETSTWYRVMPDGQLIQLTPEDQTSQALPPKP
jgi:hypothetical protein